MNILYIGVDAKGGGSALAMCEVCRKIKESGNKVYVVLPRWGEYRKKISEWAEKVYIIPFEQWTFDPEKTLQRLKIKKFFGDIIKPFAENRILKIIRTKEIDIIHINTSTTGIGIESAIKMRIPIVWHIREDVEHGLKLSFYNKKDVISKMNLAKTIMVISRSLYNQYSMFFSKDKLKLIYDGINLQKYEKIYRGKNNDKIVIAMVGRISKEKNQMELLQSQLKLKKNIIIRLIGADKGKYAKKVKQFVKNHKLSNVEFRGYCSDMYEEYKKIDIVIICSENEGFGRVAIEATVSGCVVIGADTGGTKELLSLVNGVLYKLHDIDDLTKKIEMVIKNIDIYRNNVNNKRSFFIANFSDDYNFKNINDVYNNCLIARTRETK